MTVTACTEDRRDRHTHRMHKHFSTSLESVKKELQILNLNISINSYRVEVKAFVLRQVECKLLASVIVGKEELCKMFVFHFLQK